MRVIEAKPVEVLTLRPATPFHFDGTFHKPSHFPTTDVDHEPGRYWQTLRLPRRAVGLRLVDTGRANRPSIECTIFSSRPLAGDLSAAIAREIRWRFDLDADLGEFTQRFRRDPVLGPIIRRRRGMRVSTPYSLYEYLVITIMLQNATVRRSAQMLAVLFGRYGTRIRFDGRELSCFWTPPTLHAAPEAELRALKVGYRAKSLKRVTEAFVGGAIDPLAIRAMDRERAGQALLQLYGIGPASVGYLLFDVFHHYDAFDVISPWEQRIYSRLLFDRELVGARTVLAEVKRRWGRWRMLASHYVFEDLFWRRKRTSIPWLEALIRL